MSDVECEEVLHIKPALYGSKCEMSSCQSNLDPNLKKSYFRFPKHDYFCSQWVFACGQPDLVRLYLGKGSMFFYKTKKVCEEHFIKEDFRNPALLSQGLFKGVVPTRNLPELKTIIKISSTDGTIVNLDESPVETNPVNTTIQSRLKRRSRPRKHNPRYFNSLNICQSTVKNVKNKLKYRLKNQPRKLGRTKRKTLI